MVAMLPYRSVGESPGGSSNTHPNLHFLTGKSTMSVISKSCFHSNDSQGAYVLMLVFSKQVSIKIIKKIDFIFWSLRVSDQSYILCVHFYM